MKKQYSVIYQGVVIGVVMMLSKFVEAILPFAMPSSVIGLVLLFVALCTKVVRLEQVETVGNALVDNIGLFFVPAGISVINSLDLLKGHFLLTMALIFFSTLFLLVGTGWMTQILLGIRSKKAAKKVPVFPKLAAIKKAQEVR
ncbi:antiholin-like murein hydrolase modulator LrgA [Enterococcus bulliens]